MLSKINPSALVAQCWYMRRHVPEGRRWREADGVVHCTCRYCRRPIRSRGGGRWDLAEGFDLDAIAEAGRTSYYCVVDPVNGMVIARYPVPAGADDDALAAQLAEITEAHGIDDSEGALEVRLVQSQQGLRPIH